MIDTGARSPSLQSKLESTMMIADEAQQADQPKGAMVLGEEFLHPAVVNVDVSEELLATHITREKIILFYLPVGVPDRTVLALMAALRLAIYSLNEILKPVPTHLPYALQQR